MRQKSQRSTKHYGPPGVPMNRPLTDEEVARRPFCYGRVRSLYGRGGPGTRWYRAGWLCDGCGVFAADDPDSEAARNQEAQRLLHDLAAAFRE